MKVLIAPDSFKECLPAKEVAEVIAEGLRQSLLDVEPITCPIGDGGRNFYPCYRPIWKAGRNAVCGKGFSRSL